MVHWNLVRKRQIYAIQAVLLILLVVGFSFLSDFEGQASDDAFEIVERYQMPIKELSGLTVFQGADGREKLVAVGDKTAKIVIYDPISKDAQTVRFKKQLIEKFSLCTDSLTQTCKKLIKKLSSDWEAIAAGDDGLFYILQEHSQAIVVLDPFENDIKAVINFDILAKSHGSVQKSSLKFRTNSLGEGLVKMGARFLVAKEMYPLSIVELGPKGSASRGFGDEDLKLNDSSSENIARLSYETLAHWELAGHSKCDFSELTAMNNRLLALSQKCRKLMVFNSLPAGGGSITPDEIYSLPREIRSPEALAVLSDGRIVIGSDVKKQKTNLYLLKWTRN